ncbi:unnamed protein product [Boreogadus saida]
MTQEGPETVQPPITVELPESLAKALVCQTPESAGALGVWSGTTSFGAPTGFHRRGAVGAPFGDPVLRRPPTSGPSTATLGRGGVARPVPPQHSPSPSCPHCGGSCLVPLTRQQFDVIPAFN